MDCKVKIRVEAGTEVEATAPVIISASRSTDIPAFYSEWFFNRLAKGYCAWINPFNQKKQYVSFSKCKVIVFWTKNPEPILPYLHILDEMGIHYYFQVTLNDYEREGFEPNLPSVEKRIATFRQLSDLIGSERVIWRYDPIIISPRLSPRDILKRIWKIGNLLKGSTNKLVFSFVDIGAYRKVQNNLIAETSYFTKENVVDGEGTSGQKLEIVEGLTKIRDIWNKEKWNLSLATCAELIDLDSVGIEHNRCIDDRLMKKIFHEDKELIYYLNTGKLPEANLFGLDSEIGEESKCLKDKGQRKLCGCVVSKDIGMYNTCAHFCVYCYANTSKRAVITNRLKSNNEGECIIGMDNE